ncbi:hypothetical protein LX36DRAFT_194602 [Colletotrichum falcatum]|nr:hypothetical protein LX36DRAFT_194602 [Colletotrichum falcatum]
MGLRAHRRVMSSSSSSYFLLSLQHWANVQGANLPTQTSEPPLSLSLSLSCWLCSPDPLGRDIALASADAKLPTAGHPGWGPMRQVHARISANRGAQAAAADHWPPPLSTIVLGRRGRARVLCAGRFRVFLCRARVTTPLRPLPAPRWPRGMTRRSA